MGPERIRLRPVYRGAMPAFCDVSPGQFLGLTTSRITLEVEEQLSGERPPASATRTLVADPEATAYALFDFLGVRGGAGDQREPCFSAERERFRPRGLQDLVHLKISGESVAPAPVRRCRWAWSPFR